MNRIQLRDLIKETIDEILNEDEKLNNTSVNEALSSDQRRAAKEYGLTDDEFRVNMILAKAGWESLSTDYEYAKIHKGGFVGNRNHVTGDMRTLIKIATLESSRIRDIRKAAARGDAAVSLANQYDFMEKPALAVAEIFYAQANELNGGGNIFRV